MFRNDTSPFSQSLGKDVYALYIIAVNQYFLMFILVFWSRVIQSSARHGALTIDTDQCHHTSAIQRCRFPLNTHRQFTGFALRRGTYCTSCAEYQCVLNANLSIEQCVLCSFRAAHQVSRFPRHRNWRCESSTAIGVPLYGLST